MQYQDPEPVQNEIMDIMEWTTFWGTFNAAIHTSNLTAVQKFDYLKEYLKGEAHLFFKNLELTSANYQIEIDQLNATNGKEEVLINAHFDKLDGLQPLRDGKDVAALRNLQLTIQSRHHKRVGDSRKTEIIHNRIQPRKSPRDQINQTGPIQATREVGESSNK
jgi:hypothetical protein